MEASTRAADTPPDLETILKANGAEVARSTSPEVWLSAMASISGAKPPLSAAFVAAKASADGLLEPPAEKLDSGNPLGRLAKDLGLTVEEVEAAAGPRGEPPFIHLDAKYWESLLSKPGFGKVAPPVLAATLLLLWNRHAKLGDIDSRMCAKVLSEIGIRQKNPNRAFTNCAWLQLRGDRLQLNPTAISKAEAFAAAYCRG